MEGLPHALAEAMACGCCPIAMGVGGAPEVITSPDFGWLVAPENRQGFLTAMLAAASYSPEERLRMGTRAREHVMACFNAKLQLGALADFLEATATGRPQAR
jgi:L-malate glycosyltransferase